MTRRSNATTVKAAGEKLAADLMAEAEKQQARGNYALAHELRGEAGTVSRIATTLYHRRTSR